MIFFFQKCIFYSVLGVGCLNVCSFSFVLIEDPRFLVSLKYLHYISELNIFIWIEYSNACCPCPRLQPTYWKQSILLLNELFLSKTSMWRVGMFSWTWKVPRVFEGLCYKMKLAENVGQIFDHKQLAKNSSSELKTINLVNKTVVVNTTDQQFMNLISSAFFIFHM